MHFIIHGAGGLIIALLLGLTSTNLIIFVLASVLIDVDHAIEIGIPKKKFKKEYIWDVKKYKRINYESPQKALHLFHTFEIIGFIFILSIWIPALFLVGLAFSVHLCCDAVGNVKNRNFGNAGGKDWIKYWFLFYYIKKGSVYNKENFTSP